METESLKQLGIIMTQTNLEQYALSQGITKSIDDMSQAELIQLRYSYVTEMSKNAVGDFTRTSDSTANQQRILTETVKEQTAELGQKLLPAYNNLLSTGLKVLDWFNSLNDKQKQTIINVAKILAVIGPALIIIGKIISAILSFSKAIKVIGAVTKAVWLFNASLLANNITLIILGIVALIAIIVLLIKYWDQVSSAVSSAFSNITTFFGNMFSAIGTFLSGIFNAITTFFTNAWTAFMGFVTPIIDFINNAIQIIIGILNIPYQFLVNTFILIVALVAMLLEGIYNIIAPIVMWVYNTILMPIWNFISTVFNTVLNFFINIFTAIINFIGGVIQSIKDIFLSIVGFIWNNVLSPIFNFFASIFGAIWGVISGAISKIKNGFMVFANFIKSIFQTVADFIGKIFGVVGNIIKAPINAVIGLINGVLKGLNKIKVPDWVPGLGGMSVNFPMIPKLKIGTDEVLSEGLAYLHKGESVVPANVVKGGYTNNITNNNSIILNLTTEAKVNEGVLFSANQRIDYNKNLQTGF